ncbi:hypothetical protein WDW37_09175 [Bdellovibrionota bacterium FG-1]
MKHSTSPENKAKPAPSGWVEDISRQAQSFNRKVSQFTTKRPLLIMAGALTVGFPAERYFNSEPSMGRGE